MKKVNNSWNLSQKMKLTDLNIDCLENVFEYLKLGDLINVATANKRLNKAAEFVFARDYNRKRIIFEVISQYKILETDGNSFIYISDLRTSLKMIRCFGHLISIAECFATDFETEQHIRNYINKYCSKSLTSIRIGVDLYGWEKPFPRVEKVELINCEIDSKYSIDGLFPNVRDLVIECNNIEMSFFGNPNHLPQLKRVHISLEKCDDAIVPFLRLNPQIEFITINVQEICSISSEISNAFEALKNLQEFRFFVRNLINNSMNNVLYLKNVRSFHILSTDVLKIPFSFGQIYELYVGVNVEFNIAFFKFIYENPTIRSLEIEHQNLSALDRLKLAKSLPLLESITFEHCIFSADEGIDFMSKFTGLVHFVFIPDETKTYNIIRDHFDNEWKCETSKFVPSICLTRELVKTQTNI